MERETKSDCLPIPKSIPLSYPLSQAMLVTPASFENQNRPHLKREQMKYFYKF